MTVTNKILGFYPFLNVYELDYFDEIVLSKVSLTNIFS